MTYIAETDTLPRN